MTILLTFSEDPGELKQTDIQINGFWPIEVKKIGDCVYVIEANKTDKFDEGEKAKKHGVPVGRIGCQYCGMTTVGVIDKICVWCERDMFEGNENTKNINKMKQVSLNIKSGISNETKAMNEFSDALINEWISSFCSEIDFQILKDTNNIDFEDEETDPDHDDSNECCDDCGCYHGHHPWCDDYYG